MKMSRIPFEVKTVYVILVVISQGGNSGFINNEAENLGKALFVGGFLLLFFFHFLKKQPKSLGVWSILAPRNTGIP